MKCMLVFSAKMKSQKGRLYLWIGGRFDLRRSLFFLVSHSLSLWQQMVLLWTPKLPAIHCCRMLATNILMPSFSSPWSCSPWCPDTKEKSGKTFPPRPGYQQKKWPVRSANSNGCNWPTMSGTELRDNALKKMLFRLNNHTKQVNDMSYKWITKHNLSN